MDLAMRHLPAFGVAFEGDSDKGRIEDEHDKER
jgi:hypothetical protein